MENKNFLSKSENFKEEYCCSVVRVGELTPIEGSDFLAKTNILGTQIVVRKDMVKEGDIMFYAANETALNLDFLAANNLFEIGCRDMNANAAEVNAIMEEYQTNYKNEADKLRIDAKQIKGMIDKFEKQNQKDKKKISKLTKDLDKTEDADEEKKIDLKNQIKELNDRIDAATALSLEKTVKYTELKKKIEILVNEGKPIVDKAKVLCGFFNKYGRVRCITLKNTPSFGFLFEIDSMAKFNPGIKDVNLEEYLNQDFDTVDGVLFVKAYVPPVKPENVRKSRDAKRNKKLSRFDRMVEGEFSFHYDTTQLAKNMSLMDPDKVVTISVKRHGTSIIIGKVHVKNPLPMAWPKKMWNKLIDLINLPEKIKFKYDYTVDFGPVYSSRTVIKNRYINEEVTGGYYNVDIWSEYGELIYPYLDNGMTIYGEICGYLTGCQSMIQKQYAYECLEGENNLMVYRISTMDEEGHKHEWNVQDVYDWTVKLIDRMKEANDENWKRIHPIDILYHGTLGDLYPEVDESDHWHENVLEKMKNDKEHFGMEDYEPLCKYNKVPREGIVLRIDDDPINEAFKLKTTSFALGEALLYDDDDYQDIEVQEGDYDPVEG
jgi:hypothetical protein